MTHVIGISDMSSRSAPTVAAKVGSHLIGSIDPALSVLAHPQFERKRWR